MSKIFSGSAVPRHFVFVLADGSFVVQWDTARVQELLSGKYRGFTQLDFGHPVTDYELNQLKAAGRVEHFNRAYVWLYALPEQSRHPQLRVQEQSRDRVRAYYLNTTLPQSQLDLICKLLETLGLTEEFKAIARNQLVAVLNKDGKPFTFLKDAESAQRQLSAKAPDIFKHSVIAFVDSAVAHTSIAVAGIAPKRQTSEILDLSTIIASQTDVTLTAGKHGVIVARNLQEGQRIKALLLEMKMIAHLATSAQEALMLLEENAANLLVTDLQLPDMHVWEMLAKIREIGSLRQLLTIVTAEPGSSADDQSFGLTVAKVNAYLVKPLSMARLRQNIWIAFKQQIIENDPS
jgi:CheY-like chemotaxis protein